ncbi:hypothetical protein LINPERHAP1_LOCUS15656 [Linum perenne]
MIQTLAKCINRKATIDHNNLTSRVRSSWTAKECYPRRYLICLGLELELRRVKIEGSSVAPKSERRVSGGEVFRLAGKLQKLKQELGLWNFRVFGRVDRQIEECLGAISELDGKEDEGVLSEDERVERCNIKCNLDRLWKREESLWRQRANTKAMWDPVVSCVTKRLSSWKARLLSFGGRLTLVKSVLSSLPIYYMSLFRAPVQVVKQIEKVQCRFCGKKSRRFEDFI